MQLGLYQCSQHQELPHSSTSSPVDVRILIVSVGFKKVLNYKFIMLPSLNHADNKGPCHLTPLQRKKCYVRNNIKHKIISSVKTISSA